MRLLRLLKADLLKLTFTHMIWMHLYIPLLGLFIFLSYFSYAPWSNFDEIIVYIQVLCIVFPILIGIITSMLADQEWSAGGFQNMLFHSDPKYLTMVSKLILSLLLGTISTLFAVLGFYIGYSFIDNAIFSITIYLAVAGIIVGSNIFQYILHLFLSFRFSKGISIGVGIAESLVVALFITGMGDGRWPFVPSTWSIRFIAALLTNTEHVSEHLFDPFLHLGVIISIGATVLSIVLLLIWFTRWEGIKLEE